MLGLLTGLFQSGSSLLNNDSAWTDSTFVANNLAAGEPVSDTNALTLSTWFAILRNQSEDIGKIPCHVIEYQSNGNKERNDSHPVNYLFSVQPNSYQDPITFQAQMTHWLVGWGNAYAEIERDASQRPVALHPLHPGRVMPEWDDVNQRIRYKLLLTYQFRGGKLENRQEVYIDQDNMFHLRGLGSDPLMGYSVIRMAAESLSASIAVERFGAAFFKNSGAVTGVVKHPGNMGDEARDYFVSSFNDAYKGARRAGGWILLEDGMTYEQMSIAPDDAQFIQTRILSIEEICRWLRMPPSKVQHLAKANYNSLEMQNLEYTIDSLQPIVAKWVQQAQRKLFRSDESNYSLYFNFNGLLQGNIQAQTEHIVKMIQNGVYSPNEGRSFLGQNTGGAELDQRFIAVNMQPLRPGMEPPASATRRQETMAARQSEQPKQIEAKTEKTGITYEQAKAVIGPIVDWTARKHSKATERIGKKHAGDTTAHDAAITELVTEEREEMKRNIMQFWTAFSGDTDAAMLAIESGEVTVIDFDQIVHKLSMILSKETENVTP